MLCVTSVQTDPWKSLSNHRIVWVGNDPEDQVPTSPVMGWEPFSRATCSVPHPAWPITGMECPQFPWATYSSSSSKFLPTIKSKHAFF